MGKKRQHYVPRFLLKSFSNSLHTINLYSFTENRIIENVAIKNQCYEKYIYGKNPDIENAFASLESETANIINKIKTECLFPNKTELITLVDFIFFQNIRTLESLDKTNSMLKAMLDEVIATISNEFEARINRDMIEHLYSSLSKRHLFEDLRIKILHNRTLIDLVVSDHPTILYNKWANFHPKFYSYKAKTGLASRGLIVILPISTRYLLILFDKDVYKCVSKNNGIEILNNKNDIILLNTFQFINASECVYFNNKNNIGKMIGEYVFIRNNIRCDMNPSAHREKKIKQDDGKISQILSISKPEINIKADLNFLKIINETKYEYSDYILPTLPIRSIELLEKSLVSENFTML